MANFFIGFSTSLDREGSSWKKKARLLLIGLIRQRRSDLMVAALWHPECLSHYPDLTGKEITIKTLLDTQLSLLVLPKVCAMESQGYLAVTCSWSSFQFIAEKTRLFWALTKNHFPSTTLSLSSAPLVCFSPLFLIQFAFCHSYRSVSQCKDSIKKIINKRLLCIIGHYYESCRFTLRKRDYFLHL